MNILKRFAARWPFPVRAKLKSGRPLYVDLRSGIGRGIFVKGEFDPSVFSEIANRLSPGAIFLDIGANIGCYSMQALDNVGTTGQVFAFEIDPRPLRCLRKSKSQFKLQNLHISQVALGRTNGSALLDKNSECGNSRVSLRGKGIPVPMMSLDSWIKGQKIERIDVVKIDVEGFEYEVLQGARAMVDRFRPCLVIEADDSLLSKNDASVHLIKSYLSQFGYSFVEIPRCSSPNIVATVTSPDSE